MSSSTSSDPSNNVFGAFDKKSWEAAARRELDDEEPLEKLKKTIEGISVAPYFDKTDRPPLPLRLSVSPQEFAGPRFWFNMAGVNAGEPSRANKEALHLLNAGADGLYFKIQSLQNAIDLLEGIELTACAASFQLPVGGDSFLSGLLKSAQHGKCNVQQIYGAVFWSDGSFPKAEVITKFETWSQFRPIGIISGSGMTAVEEIADLMTRVVNCMDQLPDSLIIPALKSFAFSVRADQNLFFSIAKIRALRQVWNILANSYKDGNHPVHIHVRVDESAGTAYAPHGEMLHQTLAALGAVLGGADAITIDHSQSDEPWKSRVARNISLILRDESHLDKVADPLSGAYYVDWLTQQIADKAWAKFQNMLS